MEKERYLTRRVFLTRGMTVALTAGATGTLMRFLGDQKGFCAQAEPAGGGGTAAGTPLPNIIIINADDLGYGDLGCYGGSAIRTPHIDRLAEEGARFTDFCSCNALCSPSRFGLLTGRYPQRAGIHWVFWPEEEPFKERALRTLGRAVAAVGLMDLGATSEVDGIPADEVTLAEALREAGYRTGMVGKWRLGDLVEIPEYNPLNHGFDSFFGVPYSNDMHPYPLCRNEEVLEADIEDQSKLTGLYTREAVEFIERSKDNPFFLYLAHTFPHQPLYASEDFHGKSVAGRYGDTVEEIDWSVGEVMACLERNGLERDTLIFFTSDNGPWYNGSPGGLRGRKGQSYEGGFRVPLVAWWPGHIPAGSVRSEPTINLDLFPTCLAIAGTEPPSDRIIDGKKIYGLLTGETAGSPHDALYFYHHDQLEAIRVGKWKYYRAINTYVYPNPVDKKLPSGAKGPPWLYDLERDPGESYNLSGNYPEVGEKLADMMEEWERRLEENPKGWKK